MILAPPGPQGLVQTARFTKISSTSHAREKQICMHGYNVQKVHQLKG